MKTGSTRLKLWFGVLWLMASWPSLAAGTIGESVGEGVVRFHASAEARDGALPSLCLVAPLAGEGKVPDGGDLVP